MGVRRRYVRIMVRGVVGVGGVYGRGYRRVWCPKFRRPVLAGPVGDRCDELVRRKCTEHEWTVVALGVMPAPVCLFVKVHLRHFPLSSPTSSRG
ncbi:transposase [Parafrankia sp. EAN1pec]|uniref:transposase n=1 Tax=Parafrankia sp. (strain EAN1pec) TaxID=298653 RepID=UPI00321B1067